MRECCDQSSELEMLREGQSGTLKIVLAINAVMFFGRKNTSLSRSCYGRGHVQRNWSG
jgi:hypothetical protein